MFFNYKLKENKSMAFIMKPGGQPEGEMYLTPDEGGTCKLMAQSYSGKTKTLLVLKEAKESPESNSPIDRIKKLEDYVLYTLTQLKTTMKAFDDKFGTTLVNDSQITNKITELTNFISSRDSLEPSSKKADYLVNNIELFLKERM